MDLLYLEWEAEVDTLMLVLDLLHFPPSNGITILMWLRREAIDANILFFLVLHDNESNIWKCLL